MVEQKQVTGQDVLNALMNGEIIVFNERYYRYDSEASQLEYSDYNTYSWKASNTTPEGLAEGGNAFNVVSE
ncbi:hypothetical protein [Lysinibacillus capsici]|uniref:hypothetical protein n=1 Tax=Lysinibacillus capsici TaxID=2115968 RepID=UPI0034E3022B